ncbi:MAG: N-acetylglucosamine kinase [Lactobacillus sp.]|nr:N-acetylglucosamine kinase [Lactobacillus sp.]
MAYRIGVDIGGTHVTATAYGKNFISLSRAVFGPGNIFINAEQAVKHITLSIKKAAISNQKCEKILIGIAGLESTQSPEKYIEKIKANVAAICTNISFVSDAQLALLNGLKGKDGFLTIAGTGSIVYGKQKKKYLRSGGWGYLLDDFGSGYKITQEATTKFLQYYDSGKKCSYQNVIFNYFNVQSVRELISKYYLIDRPQIAGCSAELAQAAEKGDEQVTAVFKHQGELLAKEIIRLVHRYPTNEIEYRLALSGSVLTKNTIVQEEIEKMVLEEFPQMKIYISKENNGMAVNYI